MVGAEHRRGTEVGVHRPLGVAVTMIMQRPVDGPSSPRRGEGDVERLEVVVEDGPEVVVAHPADVGGPATERRDAGDRVGRRPARHLGPVGHGGVQLRRPLLLDQGHRPLHEVHAVDEVVAFMAEHVNQCVADAHHVELGVAHEGLDCI